MARDRVDKKKMTSQITIRLAAADVEHLGRAERQLAGILGRTEIARVAMRLGFELLDLEPRFATAAVENRDKRKENVRREIRRLVQSWG